MSVTAEKEKQITKGPKVAGIIIRQTPTGKDELYHSLDEFEMARKKRSGIIGKSESYQQLIMAILKAFQRDVRLPYSEQKICPLVAEVLNERK